MNLGKLLKHPTILFLESLVYSSTFAGRAERGSFLQNVELSMIKEITSVATLPRNDIYKLMGTKKAFQEWRLILICR